MQGDSVVSVLKQIDLIVSNQREQVDRTFRRVQIGNVVATIVVAGVSVLVYTEK